MIKSSLVFAILLTAIGTMCTSVCRADMPILTVLHSFGPAKADGKNMFRKLNSDGASPSIPLIQGHDGLLYGATGTGGVNGLGTLYKINTNGTGLTVLHTFSPSDPSSKHTLNLDGSSPAGALVQDSHGTLYGAAETGGTQGGGALFKMNADGSGFTVLHTFDGMRDSGLNNGGSVPTGITLGTDGLLYGAAGGGKNGQGVIYSVAVTGQNFRILHTFSADGPDNRSNYDGADPTTALVTKNGTVFYGETLFGGNRDNTGVIYRFLAGGSGFQVLHNFDHQPVFLGADPVGTLTFGPDGSVYGNAQQEGKTNGGAVFKMSADGTAFTILHSFSQPNFDSADGSLPAGPLVFGPDGRLYGLNGYGGAFGDGTLFKVPTDGAKFFALHDFKPAESEHSLTGLTQGQDGNLYGISNDGGANGSGTIFRVAFPAAK